MTRETTIEEPFERAWEIADGHAERANGDPASDRKWLVARVAWGIHVSRGSRSPRKEWAELGDEARGLLFAEAAGAIGAYERYQPEEQSQ